MPITIMWKGESRTLADWGQRTGIGYHALLNRYRSGWDLERMMTTPHLTKNEAGRRARKASGWGENFKLRGSM